MSEDQVIGLLVAYIGIGFLWAMSTEWHEYIKNPFDLITTVRVDIFWFSMKLFLWPLLVIFWVFAVILFLFVSLISRG